jgi:hypothetical protein
MSEYKIDNVETALAHLEAYMNGGDELGDVSEADAVAALAYLRAATAPVATDARLAEIAARAEAATGGEWFVNSIYATYYATYGDSKSESIEFYGITDKSDKTVIESKSQDPVQARVADADFIAHARADIPYLLSEVKRHRAPQPVTEPATVAEAEAGLSFEKPGYGELSNLYSAVMSDFLDLKLKCAGSMKEAHSLRQELAASQSQYRASRLEMDKQFNSLSDSHKADLKLQGSIIARQRDDIRKLTEQYRAAMGNYVARKFDLAEARREAEQLRKSISSLKKANEVRVRSVVRENYVRIQALEAGLLRLLSDLDRAGLRDAFDMAVFGDLNDSLNEAAFLVEDKGEAK